MPIRPEMKSGSDFRMIASQINSLATSIPSEWEDNVLFDEDDPDFATTTSISVVTNGNAFQPASAMAGGNLVVGASGNVLRPVSQATAAAACVLNSLMLKVPSGRMSLASCRTSSAAHLAELCSSLGRNSVSSSLSDLVGSPLEISVDNIVTIEDLRMQMGSCFTCGVSWTDDHVSLDCSECGGYSMERPCLLCDGSCGSTWKRDFTMSHASGNARWLGCCPQTNANSIAVSSMQNSSSNLLGMLTNGATGNAGAGNGNTCSAAGQLAHDLCARLEKLSAHT